MSAHPRRAAPRLLCGVAARLLFWALFAIAVKLVSRFPFDDAFIHLRIARNLTLHGQPYFNLGEPVMGSSSPLWILLASGTFRVLASASTTPIVILECIVIGGLLFVSEGFLAAGRRRSLATLLGSLLVTTAALNSAGGLMETPLALTLLFGGAWALSANQMTLSGVLVALAGATRFEMLVPGLIGVILAQGMKGRFRLFAGAGPVWLAEAAGLKLTYGSVLPHTMAAKSIVFRPGWSEFFHQFPTDIGGSGVAVVLVSLAILGTVALALQPLASACNSWDRLVRARLLLASVPVVLGSVYFLKHPFIFPWYWPLSICPAALVGLSMLLNSRVRASDTRTVLAGAASISAVVLFACQGALSIAAVAAGDLERSRWLQENARTETYLEVGNKLKTRCGESAVVGAPEIGALGWAYSGKILDGVGLVSPEVLKYHPLHVPNERPSALVGAIPAHAIAELRPDVIVSMEIFATDFVRQSTVLPGLSDYRLWWSEPVLLPRTLPAGVHDVKLWGSRNIVVWARPGRCAAQL